ncbi:hypothetical protein HZS_2505 [Henneguya salminicola]|nr:hypothetical protein HZS_2505 [Henneguya salminicola]
MNGKKSSFKAIDIDDKRRKLHIVYENNKLLCVYLDDSCVLDCSLPNTYQFNTLGLLHAVVLRKIPD